MWISHRKGVKVKVCVDLSVFLYRGGGLHNHALLALLAALRRGDVLEVRSRKQRVATWTAHVVACMLGQCFSA